MAAREIPGARTCHLTTTTYATRARPPTASRAIPIDPATGLRWYARPPRPRTPWRQAQRPLRGRLDKLIERAETTSDYAERERLVDEVGALVAEQVRRVTGRSA